MSVFGLSGSDQARHIQEQDARRNPPFDLHGDNISAVDLFLFCQTQWRTGGMGGRTGLDYPAVISVMREQGLPRREREDLLWRVRAIEGGALGEWARQQREREAKRAR